VLQEGHIIVSGGRWSAGGRVVAPVIDEPDLEDEKACRAKIIERLNREEPLR
jgi:hypothetical protein